MSQKYFTSLLFAICIQSLATFCLFVSSSECPKPSSAFVSNFVNDVFFSTPFKPKSFLMNTPQKKFKAVSKNRKEWRKHSDFFLQLKRNDDQNAPVGLVPNGIDEALDQCKAALTSAALSGKRGLQVNILIPALDLKSRGFDRELLIVASVRLAEQLSFAGSGPRLLIFQDAEMRTAAESLLNRRKEFAGVIAKRQLLLDHLQSSPDLYFPKKNDVGASFDVDQGGADVLVLVSPSNSAKTKVTALGRAWMQAAIAAGKLIMVLNQAFDAVSPQGTPLGLLPVELNKFELAYHVEGLSLQPTSGPSEFSASPPPASLAPSKRLCLTRRFPGQIPDGQWALWEFLEDDMRYNLLQQWPTKPSNSALLTACSRLLGPHS